MCRSRELTVVQHYGSVRAGHARHGARGWLFSLGKRFDSEYFTGGNERFWRLVVTRRKCSIDVELDGNAFGGDEVPQLLEVALERRGSVDEALPFVLALVVLCLYTLKGGCARV